MKYILSLLLLLSLTSCFETDVNSGSIPFYNENGDSGALKYEIHFNVAGAPSYLGLDGTEVASEGAEPAIRLPFTTCIRRFESYSDVANTITLHVNGDTNAAMTNSHGAGDYQSQSSDYYLESHDKVVVKVASASTGRFVIVFENCD